MADKPASEAPVYIPLCETSHAPFLYFESVPNFGTNDGICNITLEAMKYTAVSGKIEKERVPVAHLRMGMNAAKSLHDALGKMFLMASRTPDIRN